MNTDIVGVKNKYKISFSYSSNYNYGKVRVHKKVIQALGAPKFIQFLIKPEDKLLFIVGLDHREHDSFPVVCKENGKSSGMILNGQRFVRKMSEIGGWQLEGRHVIGGTFIESMNMIEFNLTNVLNNAAECDL